MRHVLRYILPICYKHWEGFYFCKVALLGYNLHVTRLSPAQGVSGNGPDSPPAQVQNAPVTCRMAVSSDSGPHAKPRASISLLPVSFLFLFQKLPANGVGCQAVFFCQASLTGHNISRVPLWFYIKQVIQYSIEIPVMNFNILGGLGGQLPWNLECILSIL